jgi:streptomycin 6-kinase
VVKLTWPAERVVDEAGALAAWRGQGAVLLLEADPEVGALLLERLDPTRTLERMDLRAAAQVAGRLLRRLAIPAPEGVRPLRVVADGIGGSLHGRQERLGRPVPEGWLAAAGDLAPELGASAGDRLVHADLHYGNVLAGNREPWLAIDRSRSPATPSTPFRSCCGLGWTSLRTPKRSGACWRSWLTVVS